jgi:transcriptional regulator with XRE-family HTH domain
VALYKCFSREVIVLRIRYERLRRGFGQVDLAFHARMQPADISRIETGRLKPYPSQLARLSSVLGVKPDALLLEVLKPPRHGRQVDGAAEIEPLVKKRGAKSSRTSTGGAAA